MTEEIRRFPEMKFYRLLIGFIFVRHTRESGYPVSIAADHWIPAFAGMTATNTVHIKPTGNWYSPLWQKGVGGI
jgi:hypothetical protein